MGWDRTGLDWNWTGLAKRYPQRLFCFSLPATIHHKPPSTHLDPQSSSSMFAALLRVVSPIGVSLNLPIQRGSEVLLSDMAAAAPRLRFMVLGARTHTDWTEEASEWLVSPLHVRAQGGLLTLRQDDTARTLSDVPLVCLCVRLTAPALPFADDWFAKVEREYLGAFARGVPAPPASAPTASSPSRSTKRNPRTGPGVERMQGRGQRRGSSSGRGRARELWRGPRRWAA